MATVFLATDIKHDREVAIKVLHPELSASIGGERFEREIKLAAKLQHPHILGMYDSGQADGLLYYVMPFVKGESLRDRLDREGQLPIDDAIQLILEVADALGAAHAQGIVHRDIKPENVLLSNGHALVADFGIARAAHEAGGQKLTQTGMAVGTPVYMSPEQAVGDPVGPTSDLYSLGCMLYELLAGEPPFTAKNAMALMARHAMEAVPSIRIIRNTVPEEVEDAIFAAMAKVPADRPKDAAHFAELLGAPLGSTMTRRAAIRQTASRRIPTGMQRALPVAPPWWKQKWVLAVAALVLVAGGFGAWRLAAGGSRKAAIATGGLDPHRIAVLYFNDVSGDKSLGLLADGLTEALIGTLGQVQGLTVVSQGGVRSYKGSSVSTDSIARALNVGTLIRGSVDSSGGKIRVSLALVEGASGADIDRASVEQPTSALLGVRDTLAEKAALLIRTRLGESIKLQGQRQGTNSVPAWSLVQRAEQLRRNGEAAAAQDDSVSRDKRDQAFGAADSLLALAEKEDPAWPEPIVMRGLVAYRRSRAGLDPVTVQKWVTVGIDHANRALALDPKNADALEIRGNLRYWTWLMGLEPDETKGKALLLSAKDDLEASTRSNPAQAGAWASLSHLYYNAPGTTATDVNLAATRAWQADAFLDNASAILDRLFQSSYDTGQFTAAANWCAETQRRFPTSLNAPNCELYLLTTKVREPDPARAWRLADSVTALSPGPRKKVMQLQSQMMVAMVLARADKPDSARRLVERSKGDAEIDPTRDITLFGAYAYVALKDRAKAIDMLKVYFAANPRSRAAFAEDPGWQLRSLSDDPEFKLLVGSK